MDNIRTFIALPSANATRQIPGNGRGSSLSEVIATLTIAASTGNAVSNPRIVTLSAITSLALGQLIICSGGLWGTIIGIENTGTAPGAAASKIIEVDEWRGGTTDHKRKPQVAEATRVFPAGSCLATCKSVRLHSINVIDNSGQSLTFYDYATAALFTTLNSLDLGMTRFASPFCYSTNGASVGFMLVFEVQ